MVFGIDYFYIETNKYKYSLYTYIKNIHTKHLRSYNYT